MNKNAKKIALIALTFAMLLSASACNGKTNDTPEDTDSAVTTAPSAPETTAPVPADTEVPDTEVPDTDSPYADPEAEAVTFDSGVVDAYISSHTRLNVVECGADSTGVKDNTLLMQYLHNSGKEVYYPNGTYLFNGTSLNFSGGLVFESYDGVLIRNGISDVSIVNFDDFGNLIGLMQNHLEVKTGGTATRNGSLVEAPLSTAQYDTAIDILPYFYNDFGLERTLTGEYGWDGWYYWSWNHHDCETVVEESDPYDASRHPLLGYYYGDDPVVLDWQCYWLREYGMNQMVVVASPNPNTWENPTDKYHWAYELFNNVKNFRDMKYVLTVPNTDTRVSDMEQGWKNIIDIYAAYPHYYTIEQDGKTYAVLMNWRDKESSANIGSATDYVNMITRIADYTREKLGVDGCFLICRTIMTMTDSQLSKLEASGVIRVRGAFESYNMPNTGKLTAPNEGYDTYEGYLEGFDLDDFNEYLCLVPVSTALKSHSPHPSGWAIDGSTPALFEKWLSNVMSAVSASDDHYKIVAVNGVADWAECGPGLQPNVQDGFGYLKAVADALGIQIRNTVK